MKSKIRDARVFALAVIALVVFAASALNGCGGGSGGSGGAGGASGQDPCVTCEKADACCKAYASETGGDPSQCTFASSCQAVAASDRDQLVTACQTFTTTTASGVPSPTECR